MNRIAYLIMFLDRSLGVAGFGIYSESAQSLTLDHGRTIAVDVLIGHGGDYEEARAAVLADLEFRAEHCPETWGAVKRRLGTGIQEAKGPQMTPFTKPSEVLSHAARCVEYGHARSVLARDAKGHAVEPRSPHAVCWCTIGALERSTADRDLHFEAIGALRLRIGDGNIALWSDNAPTRKVVATLRAAARDARRAGR